MGKANRSSPLIALTMGDPNGVGPELIVRSFADRELPPGIVVVGDHDVLVFASDRLDLDTPVHGIDDPEDVVPERLNVLDQRAFSADQITVGRISREAGQAARSYLVKAAELAISGVVSAIVTLPIHKEAVRLSDPSFSGHTELLAASCGWPDHAMMLYSDKLAVVHVTTHVPLNEAIRQITSARVAKVIELAHATFARIRPGAPRIAVAGLNPHAGEHGSFGREEEEIIGPAIAACRSRDIDVVGPLPPDTVFLQASRGRFDVVIAMYHDQGHIPMKLLDFEGTVNVTLGLPIVRTSVDHGTAFDIAYKGCASTRSLTEACRLALRLIHGSASPVSV